MKSSTRIRIGNQTAFSAADPLAPFYYAIENHFDAFEWFPDKKGAAGWDIGDLSAETRRAIREAARAHDIALSVHAPWWADPLQSATHGIILANIGFAAEIGATLFNIHLQGGLDLEPFTRAILPFIEATAQTGIRLAIENTVLTTPADCNRFFELLSKIQGPAGAGHVGLCLDLGHANLSAQTRNNYLRFVDQLSPHVPLIHIHLHENYGDHDSHLPLFTGPAGANEAGIRGLLERLARRGFAGAMILEQWPEPPTLLNEAHDRLLAMLGRMFEKVVQDAVKFLPKPASSRSRAKAGPAAKLASRRAGTGTGDDDETFVHRLVAMDETSRSFREKLAGLNTLLQDCRSRLSQAQLVYIAIYLRFLGTGELPCTEDGRHFRPSHHARLAQQILQRLAVLTATGRDDFLLRRIEPWLPSYDSAFIRAEPLTRIRDIAHRNDIPRELKKELKETLQNKLHRCAGPEDLATSAALLKKITAPEAGYPPAFVREFSLFHRELQEFFNARPLRERLAAMLARAEIEPAPLVRRWLARTATPKDSAREHLARLQLTTELRSRLHCAGGLKTELAARNLRLADIGLEDYAFMVASSLINDFAAQRETVDTPWQTALKALTATLANVRIGGIEPHAECLAVEADFAAWQHQLDPADRDWLLLVKANLERCLRLADSYTDRVLALFPERVARLGAALGVAEHAIRIYSEADIRANLVFQLAKLASLLLKKIRLVAGLPAWDVLVPGTACGRLVAAGHLADPETAPSQGEQRVVLLTKAEGDEEMPAGVTAILLCHELPRLSHMAVRARQAGVVFAACEEKEEAADLRRYLGQTVRITAKAETFAIEPAALVRARKVNTVSRPRLMVPAPEIFAGKRLLELSEVSMASSGAKAAGARRLAELADLPAAGFKTPHAVVVPFAVMEEALGTAPGVAKEYQELIERLEAGTQDQFPKIVRQLRNLAANLAVPEEITADVAERFSGASRLIVRSSANCEDLQDMAGAGLYDSIANVNLAGLATAMAKVWGSLWTERAAANRTQAAIPHRQARMAVIIQELVVPDFSFVIHTVNPISGKRDELYLELAVGLGESIASGAMRGSPCRLVCNLSTGHVRMLAAASFSSGLWPDATGGLAAKTVRYADIALSTSAELRLALGRRLAVIGRFVEEAAGCPQDIEGVVAGEDIFLVQARAQQGLEP